MTVPEIFAEYASENGPGFAPLIWNSPLAHTGCVVWLRSTGNLFTFVLQSRETVKETSLTIGEGSERENRNK